MRRVDNPLAVIHQHRGLALDDVAKPASEIGLANHRAVDARRRHFQMIRLVDRILDVENGRDGHRYGFATFDIHCAVGAFCHDLQRHSVLVHHTHANQLEIHRDEHGLDNICDTTVKARLSDDPCFAEFRLRHVFGQSFYSRLAVIANKKERVLPGPPFICRSRI